MSCEPEGGRLEPRIGPLRCEGKADCIRVCPQDVFLLRPLTREEKVMFMTFQVPFSRTRSK